MKRRRQYPILERAGGSEAFLAFYTSTLLHSLFGHWVVSVVHKKAWVLCLCYGMIYYNNKYFKCMYFRVLVL